MESPLPTDREVVWSQWIAFHLGGQAEVRLEDGTRADIILPTAVVEVEWIKKWKSGIGQALHYAAMTGKQPTLILLTRGKPRESLYLESADIVARKSSVSLLTWSTRR